MYVLIILKVIVLRTKYDFIVFQEQKCAILTIKLI